MEKASTYAQTLMRARPVECARVPFERQQRMCTRSFDHARPVEWACVAPGEASTSAHTFDHARPVERVCVSLCPSASGFSRRSRPGKTRRAFQEHAPWKYQIPLFFQCGMHAGSTRSSILLDLAFHKLRAFDTHAFKSFTKSMRNLASATLPPRALVRQTALLPIRQCTSHIATHTAPLTKTHPRLP